VRQVNVQGLVAAAFTHRDSRSSDPDLHTHVAVANKVQTLDGRWLSIDGRVLFKATVAASETYNTALEYHGRFT
jgi:conjugative relaxase-like TrwC/TraI family protein